jgi:hypothetical protein
MYCFILFIGEVQLRRKRTISAALEPETGTQYASYIGEETRNRNAVCIIMSGLLSTARSESLSKSGSISSSNI